MDFIEKLKVVLNEDFNVSVTENGAVGYRTSGNALLDLTFSLSSMRNELENVVAQKYAKAFYENKYLAIKWLFYAADARGGLGERRFFRICFKFLALSEPEIAKKLLPLVAEYTRWDNLLPLLDTPLKDDVCALLKAQLDLDVKNMQDGKPVSLCAKWMPSPNVSSKETKEFAKTLIKAFGITEREYRKTLSSLRAYLNVVEVKMSRKEWEDINYEHVPSRANLVYNGAFLRNDEERRREYLAKLEKGEVKINSSVLFPHDIVHYYVSQTRRYERLVKKKDPALEKMWEGLPDFVQGDDKTLCVVDGSGSMCYCVGKTNVTCLEVANALGIYFAERCVGQFKDKFISFSENPQFVDFSHCKSLHDKIAIALTNNEMANTNIEAVFDLILKTAVTHNMSQSELPKTVLILSDMEFDTCADSSNYGRTEFGFKRLFEVFTERYAEHGYLLPKLVFWNICGRSGTIPIKENQSGVALVSGFSPSIVKMVLSGELDPLKCLLEQLNVERYEPVATAIKGLV